MIKLDGETSTTVTQKGCVDSRETIVKHDRFVAINQNVRTVRIGAQVFIVDNIVKRLSINPLQQRHWLERLAPRNTGTI